MMQYNFYFGTIGTCKYRYTKWCKSEQDATRILNNEVSSFYYKNEGKFGISTYDTIVKESEITGVDIEQLYKDHIYDMMRGYIIPTEIDTIPNKKLKL
jgi:hypothetical protein